MSKLLKLLAQDWNISGSRWNGGRQELMLNGNGKIWTTSHTQGGWTEYEEPVTCILSIDSNTDWTELSGEFDTKICEKLVWFWIYEHSVPEEDRDLFLNGEVTAEELVEKYSLEEYTKEEAIQLLLNERDYEETSDDILLYLQENDTLQVPVFDTIPENYTKKEIESGCNRISSIPKYNWTLYAVYDKYEEFVGIYSEEE